VSYEIDIDILARTQIRALPPSLRSAARDAIDVLALVPWNGVPHHEGNPDGAVRQMLFGPNGAGMVVYLILEDQQRVDVLEVMWLG
jgi:hypothetical protein